VKVLVRVSVRRQLRYLDPDASWKSRRDSVQSERTFDVTSVTFFFPYV
jgi:hypothetical protein